MNARKNIDEKWFSFCSTVTGTLSLIKTHLRLLCSMVWLNIKWFSMDCAKKMLQPLKFRLRVIWHSISKRKTVCNVISVIYVRTDDLFSFYYFSQFLFFMASSFLSNSRFFFKFISCILKKYISFFFRYSENSWCASSWRKSNIVTMSIDSSVQR